MYEYHRRTGEKHRVLMLFDLMFFNARDYRQKNFDKRNGAMREYVLVPHNRHLDKLPPDEQRKWRERQPFQITGKKLFTPYHIKDAFEHPSNLSMKMDGLIFTRASAPYTTGTNEAMLKWKPVEENSVDFEVRPLSENPDEHIFELYVTQMARKKIFISVLTLRPEDQSTWSAEKLKTGTILECWYDLKEPDPDRRWRPMRVREDKDTSNHISTYTNVMKSMIESISRDCLLENQDRIRDNWKAR
ncbi:DNA ligase/mRNA capping enzyme, partial [Caulochytrium protostelioides]